MSYAVRGESFVDRAKLYSDLIARPRSVKKKYQTVRFADEDVEDRTDNAPDIFPHSQDFHVPFFIVTISIIELLVFLYHVIELRLNHCLTVDDSGPVPLCSVLIYNPFRRYEVWRLVTYMLVHAGWVHITCNVIVQLVLGIPLEIYHGPYRICVVYLAGVLTGALVSSVTDATSFLAGASGGVYALLLAHLPTLIMNWKSMKTFVEWIVSIVILCIGLIDFGIAIYQRYASDGDNQSVGYAAHLGGAAGGFLIGMNVLRNLEHQPWEGILRLICWVLWVTGVIVIILINSFGAKVIFPKSDFTDIKMCSYYDEDSCSLD